VRAHNLLSEVPVSFEASRHVRAPSRCVMVARELTKSMTHLTYLVYLYYVNYTYSMITFTIIVDVHVLTMLYYNTHVNSNAFFVMNYIY
jgi:hypothetical protein